MGSEERQEVQNVRHLCSGPLRHTVPYQSFIRGGREGGREELGYLHPKTSFYPPPLPCQILATIYVTYLRNTDYTCTSRWLQSSSNHLEGVGGGTMFPYFSSDLRFKEVRPGPTGQLPFSKFKSCMKSVSNESEEQDKSLLEIWEYKVFVHLVRLFIFNILPPTPMHTCSLPSWLPSTSFGAGLASLCRWLLPSSSKLGERVLVYFSRIVDRFG